VFIYGNQIYPFLVSRMGDPKPIREIRKRIIGQAEGVVLEIGAGSGANFVHYDPTRVTKLYALEPNPGMIRFAQRQRLQTQLDVEYLDLPGERIPLEDRSVDSIVSTFTLGTIPDVLPALVGMRRVLRPRGRLIFFELGLSSDPSVRRWQERWDPVAYRLFEGLHLTRDIPSILNQGGFAVEKVESMYLAAFPKSWTYCMWGTAC
jgi:ubiquinone/menaquinone biosynthesis C-methylase UbiE